MAAAQLVRHPQSHQPDGFKFIVWDAEHVLKDVNENVVTVNSAGSPAQIYNALRNNAEFRLRFADHLQKLFFNGGLFYTDPNPANALWDPAHPERNIPASYYMKRITEITNAIVDESARWGGYYGWLPPAPAQITPAMTNGCANSTICSATRTLPATPPIISRFAPPSC